MLIVPWCAYIARQCPFIVWKDGMAAFPEDWLDVEDFALQWQEVDQEKPEEIVPQEENDPLPYCGCVTTLPEGEMIEKIGDREYYEASVEHPFSVAFAQRYMADLEKHSRAIHPMQLAADAGLLDQGWMFKRRRLEVARELLTALKRNTNLPLYIPGDGVGFFSLAARELNIPYFSSEPAGFSRLPMRMRLITVTAAYFPAHGDGHVMIASQLMPFVPAVLHHPGPRVIFDQQRWYPNHPKELKILASTGHRVCYTGTLLRGYQPLLLLDKGFSTSAMVYIVSKVEDFNGYMVSEDKAIISKCMLAGFVVASRSYSDYGPSGWIHDVKEDREYLNLGRGPGCVDPITQTDVNRIRPGKQGEPTPIYYGREGVKVYSPYHNYAVPFSSVMMWSGDNHFYELRGMYRQRVRYRARKWPIPGRGEVLAIRTRGMTEPVIAVQYGSRMYSAEVDERTRVEVGGWMITPVSLGVPVAQVQDIRKARSLPTHVIAHLIEQDRWYSELEFKTMTMVEIAAMIASEQ